ncbi:MAG: AMP-binding protein [Fibromonadaceae bacterium]|jgi:long-chain acyl-CoA synthetase|nr:AMP-binding protein [Fibromonadaceae bacterium]
MSIFTESKSLPALAFKSISNPNFKGLFHRVEDDWICYSPKDLQESIYLLSLALKKAGVGKDIGVGIIAPSSPKWFIVDIATQICGGYVVPLFANISSEHFDFQIKDAKVKILVIDLWEALSPQISELLDSVDSIVHFSALPNDAKHKGFFSWEKFIEEGKTLDSEAEREALSKRLEAIEPSEVFSVIYTSGSTGTPKGVPLTQNNMIVHLRAVEEMFPVSAEVDVCMSILPVAHVFERMAVYYFSAAGLPIYFADSPNNIGKYLPDIRPTVLTVVPRVLEKLYEKLTGAANQKRGPIKWLMKYAISKAKSTDPGKVSLRGTIWDKLVYSKMRAALGDNFKLIVSGSSALNVSVNRFLRNIGLPLYEGYGMTECSPVISTERKGCTRMGSVGRVMSGVQVRISPENEILAKGENVFSGYLNRPELNAEIFTEDGYFRTGDKGRMDEDGFIWITGRLKEMFKTSYGKYVSPVPIEQALCQRSFVEAAQVFAEGKKFTSALLFLNQDMIRNRLKKSESEFDPERALKSRRLNASIQRHIERVNKNLDEWERIKKWKAIFTTLSTENGLLTPTLKLRRKTVEKRFENLIDEMYE